MATVGGNLKLQSQHLSDMMVGYDGGSGNSLLYLSPAGISEGVGGDTSNKCSESSVLISHVRPDGDLGVGVERC